MRAVKITYENLLFGLEMRLKAQKLIKLKWNQTVPRNEKAIFNSTPLYVCDMIYNGSNVFKLDAYCATVN